MPVEPVLLLVYTLALVSLTRFVAGLDTMTHRPSEWVVGRLEALPVWLHDRLDDERWSAGWFTTGIARGVVWFVVQLITCVWCVSFWLALCVVLPVMYKWGEHPVSIYIALALAMRQVAGLLADR